ncbi:MAG: hypothetical protein WA056_10890 [Gallionella sp.]
MNGLDKKLEGLKIVGGVEARASAALLHLSLEHFGAIVVLLQSQLNGSAAALVRLQYEALIRGMYFYQCASESEAEQFFMGAEPPKVKIMIEALEKKPGFTSGVFSRVHQREWKTMNSYTHGGSAQVQRRYTDFDLANHYSESDRLDILKAAKGIALLAATHAALAFGSLEIAMDLKEEFGNSVGAP